MVHNYWANDTIRRILTNEMYIGTMIQGKCKKVSYKSNKFVSIPKSNWIIVENNHEPIISKKQFYKVQSLFGVGKKATKNRDSTYICRKINMY